MIIYFYEDYTETALEIDDNNICFSCGVCYFSSGGKEYRINTADLLEIVYIK